MLEVQHQQRFSGNEQQRRVGQRPFQSKIIPQDIQNVGEEAAGIGSFVPACLSQEIMVSGGESSDFVPGEYQVKAAVYDLPTRILQYLRDGDHYDSPSISY
jgi:hypothetical protein